MHPGHLNAERIDIFVDVANLSTDQVSLILSLGREAGSGSRRSASDAKTLADVVDFLSGAASACDG